MDYGVGCLPSWLVLVLICVTMCGCQPVEYDVLVLVPLSGEREGRGRAQLAGVRTALRAQGYNVTNGHTLATTMGNHDNRGDISHIHIFYQDTQCDRTQEDAAILKHLSTVASRRLIVLGGYCETSRRQHVTSLQDSLVVRENLPQVLFDAAPLHNHVSPFHISLRPSIMHIYPHLVSWLRTNNFLQVAVVSASSGQDEVRPELAECLLSNNINISVTLPLEQVQLPTLLKESKSRVVVVETAATTDVDALCGLLSRTSQTPGRYVWVVMVTDAMTQLQGRSRVCPSMQEEPTVYFFNVETSLPPTERFNDGLIQTLKSERLGVTTTSYDDVSFAHDVTTLVLRTLRTFQKVPPTISSRQFTDRFLRQLTRGHTTLATGDISFDDEGVRHVPVEILSFKGAFIVPTNKSGHHLGNGTIGSKYEIDGIPLAVFIIMVSLSILGVVYTAAIFIFNVVNRNDRMIKMTSPNINLIILLGAAMGYVAMVTLGLDSKRVSMETMSKLVQASTFLLTIGYSLIFGSLFAKAWRVFFIFKNLNANGKNTRDEHLLLGIILLVVADVIVLIPWAVVDPIRCSPLYLSTSYQEAPPTDVIHMQDVCQSELLVMWILVLFFLKAVILIAGFYFTFQARHVTLPTLRDAKQVYIIIYTVVVLGIISLPLLLIPRLSTTVKYSIGALVIFAVVTAALTLAFVPKMYYVWMRAEKNSQDSVRFQFSESLRRTQKHLASCSLCFCLGSGEEEDKYATQVLGSEIETLKRTIKEKDATIRELTDRLYFGTEKKLHEYISSPRHRTLYRPEPLRPLPQQSYQGGGKEARHGHSPDNRDQGLHGAANTEAAPTPEGSDSADSSRGSCDSMYRSYSEKSRHHEKRRKEREVHPPVSRTTSAPLMSLSVRGLKENNSKIEAQITNNLDTPIKERYHPQLALSDSAYEQDDAVSPGCNSTRNATMLTDITVSPKYHSPSPNHDSAIDNNSPSSINSDQQQFPQELSLHPEDHDAMRAMWNHRGKLDLEAIEKEASRLDSSQNSKTMYMDSPRLHNQGFLHTDTPYCMKNGGPHNASGYIHRNNSYDSRQYNQYYSPRHDHYRQDQPEYNGYNCEDAIYENCPIQSDHNYFSYHPRDMGEMDSYYEDGVNVSQI